jgi:1,4-alpha-glucan branching enzyme
VVVSPYDAELFGHWWFEGPQWLNFVLREAAAQGGELGLSTPGEYLSAYPIHQKATPAPSSWGRNGYNEHWINPATGWIFPALYEAAGRLAQAVARAQKQTPSVSLPFQGGEELQQRALRQAARELMLAQSSDWPFIITNGTATEYARRRLNDHLNRLHDLLAGLEKQDIGAERLAALEHMDALFPQIDYTLFAPTVSRP